jgi:hypothetical protein
MKNMDELVPLAVPTLMSLIINSKPYAFISIN